MRQQQYYLMVSIIFMSVMLSVNSLFAQSLQSHYYNVQEHGVKPHKDSISTAAIQALIDKCHANGGGTIYFPPGAYGSGQLYLKSNVAFYLDINATLYASTNPAHYKPRSGNYVADNQMNLPNEQALFYGDSVSNIAFYGKGRLHGQARRVWEPLKEIDMFIEKETENARKSGIPMERFYAVEPKIRLIFIHKASHILVRDITLEESPDWTLHLGHTDNVVIEGITLLSSLEAGVNADGIDIDGCRNVRISNCYIATGDDAICLKSTNRKGEYKPCENIVVNNCTLVSTSTALKIGTESHGDFRNIIFSNCVITNTNRGISIVVRDGATVENVYFTNLIIECNRKHFNWWGDGDPIRFILLKRNPQSRLGNIRNVFVQNVTATGMGTSLIQGYEDRPLENIVFDNVRFTLQPETLSDKRATEVLQIKNAKDITLRHTTISWDTVGGIEQGWRSAIWAQQVDGLQLQWLQLKNTWKNKGLLRLDNVNGLRTERKLPEIFLKPSGAQKKPS
jgi:hypothetical protein